MARRSNTCASKRASGIDGSGSIDLLQCWSDGDDWGPGSADYRVRLLAPLRTAGQSTPSRLTMPMKGAAYCVVSFRIRGSGRTRSRARSGPVKFLAVTKKARTFAATKASFSALLRRIRLSVVSTTHSRASV